MTAQHGARVIAAERYRLRTLTVRDHIFSVVLKGNKELYSADRRIAVTPGNGVMIASGTQWDVVNDPARHGQYEAVVIAFDDETVRELGSRPPWGDAATVRSAQVLSVDAELSEAMQRTLPQKQARPVSSPLLRHRAIEVLLQLAEHGYGFAPTAELDWADRVRRMVAQRPHADWNTEALASAFHVSESTLRRRIEGSGSTLARLVREVRLETALAMLQTMELPIGEVAQRCGWDSHSRFSAAFQERWGVAPIIVRSRMKETAQALTENG